MFFRNCLNGMLLALTFSCSAAAQETIRTIFRFEISGPGIGRGAEQIEVELFIRGGANLSQSDRDRALRQSLRGVFRNADYFTEPVELRERLGVLDVTETILVYGHVRDIENQGLAIAYIPVTLVRVTPGEAVDMSLRTVPDLETFFLQSHPFRLQADTGLMNDENAREVLLSLRLILEYFLAEDAFLSDEQWLRFNAFLSGNQDFLVSGQDELVLEVLNYLSSSSALSTSHLFLRHYGLFLKDLLDSGSGRQLGDGNLGTRIVEDLRRLYRTRFKSSYFSADDVLEGLNAIGLTGHCLELAGISLGNLDTAFFTDVTRYDRHIEFLLINSLNCAISDYSATGDAGYPSPEALADYLYDNPAYRQYMIEFVRVVEVLQQDFNALRNRNELNLINFGSAFGTRLGE